MDRERIDRWLEQGILGLICLILGAAPFLFGGARLIDFAWIEGLTAMAVVLWTVRFWVRKEYRMLWPPLAWAVIAFLLYVVWRYTKADVEWVARIDLNRILVYAAIFFLILDNFNKQEWTQILVCVLIFVGMAAAMYAIYQFATGSRWIYNTPQPPAYHGRAGGPFVCPNHLANYIAMVVPLAFALTLMARLSLVLKVFLCYAGIVMLGGAFVTLSRAGCAALAIGLLGMFTALLFNRDFRIKAIVAIVVILIPVAWVATKSISAQHRMKKGFSEAGFGDDRFLVWPAAKAMWQENFWTGVGPGHFDLRYPPYRPPLEQLQVKPRRVHNDYLNTLADYGMIGFALVTVAWGVFWLGVVRIWRFVRRGNDFGSRQSTRAAIVLGGCAGLVALMVHCIVDFNIHIPALAIVAATLLAIVTGHWRFATERFWVRPGMIGRLAGSLVCAALAAWLGFNSVRAVREQRLIARAERLPAEQAEAYRAMMMKAHKIDPKNAHTPELIGWSFRRQSWKGGRDYRKQAEQAIEWFQKSIALDPHAPQGFIGIGMCLHWLDRRQEAWPYFREAKRIDPNNYWVNANYGWHFIQFGAWRQAGKWLFYSRGLKQHDNPITESYIGIVLRKIEEEKTPPAVSQPLPAEETEK